MQRSTAVKNMIVTGMFIAIGIILPFFTSHGFGIPGTLLLPMHIPVLLCGLICGPRWGAMGGAITPALSSLLTGMPAPYPMLPIMIAQLTAMGAASGVLSQKLNRPIYIALPGAVVGGWAVYALVFNALMFAGGAQLQALSAGAAVIRGLPGLAIQLTLIPVLIVALERYQKRKIIGEDLLTHAKAMIKSGEASCIVIKNGKVARAKDGRGVSPLLEFYKTEPQILYGAFVVDKIIGKAAAMILTLGGAKEVYGEVISAAALEYLNRRGLPARFGRCVDVISARDGKGICPIEKSVLKIDDPAKGLAEITKTITGLIRVG
jgi:riboflavin transporter FmnP